MRHSCCSMCPLCTGPMCAELGGDYAPVDCADDKTRHCFECSVDNCDACFNLPEAS